ncbi:MAG TPA: carbamate kinase [Gaiellaceae bacterium]|nr:carbamate kinase [Gaiellaceae bacterium]
MSATVIALGGNALMRPGERGTAAEQLANLRRAVTALRPLLAQPGIVLTHGNGPQVGNELIRQERAADEAPPLPLWLAVAQTQAEIGALIAAELRAHATPACLLTHVRVAGDDPAFDRPTKPIGPFYSGEQAEELERERGWTMVSDANRGHRRVVPSPQPLEVVELEVIRRLADSGAVVVACGGGGIPVVRRGDRLTGVDAVIDKDRASALLARGLGAERLIILTEVPAVYRNFGEPDQEGLPKLSRDDAEELLPELAEGSMRPKVEAALAFGGETLITNFEGLESGGGTRIA